MDNRECLVLLRGEKPMRLYKIIPDEHPSFGRLRDVKVSDYVPHWRQEEEQPKSKPAPPPPEPAAEPDPVPSKPPAPDPQQETAPEQTPPAKSSEGWAPKYDYGLLDPEVGGYDGADPQDTPGQDARYGAFDLIETKPQDVGGEQKEGQR